MDDDIMSEAGTADDLPSLGLDHPPQPKRGGEVYRVLARKYRPQRFEDLIGQEAMVRTLKNAFATGRIAHAFMLTGVRGVGKTTTARIIARALNYEGPDGRVGPTIDMPVPGAHCEAIAESRHPDVLEMDAASRTGINDIREIIEGVRYAPTVARNKVYIIDEVHMLSTAAFNGLLKTLEEPPPHVIFIFATTEVRKVPVTVLSRCQRFDLKRIEPQALIALLTDIVAKEDAAAEPGALALIARAAEGSARDALSILDQAIAQSSGQISENTVREMLGLADRTQTIEILSKIFAGESGGALKQLELQLQAGGDPLAVMQDLSALVHIATKAKVVGALRDDTLPAQEADALLRLSESTSIAHLSRAWQMLLKGISEVQMAGDSAAAAEMLVIRLAHVSNLPSPDELVKHLVGGGSSPDARKSAASEDSVIHAASGRPEPRSNGAASRLAPAPEVQAASSSQPQARLNSFEDVVVEAERRREIRLATELKRDVGLIRFEWGRLEFEPGPHAAADLAARTKRALEAWTGSTWMVSVAKGDAKPTLRAQRREARDKLEAEVSQDPLVKAILQTFPGSKIAEINERGDMDADILPAAESDDDISLDDE